MTAKRKVQRPGSHRWTHLITDVRRCEFLKTICEDLRWPLVALARKLQKRSVKILKIFEILIICRNLSPKTNTLLSSILRWRSLHLLHQAEVRSPFLSDAFYFAPLRFVCFVFHFRFLQDTFRIQVLQTVERSQRGQRLSEREEFLRKFRRGQ